MADAGIGRLLVASLHQAIADELPGRLEFYENWLHPEGLRHGTIGLAPLGAVLSFLRQEGLAYDAIMKRAGTYAADWALAANSLPLAGLVRRLPGGLRTRVALGAARRLIPRCHRDSRMTFRVRREGTTVSIRGSVFCTVREPAAAPLCGFYAAVVTRMLAFYGVGSCARTGPCHGVGAPACVLSVEAQDGQPGGRALGSGTAEGEERVE